MGLPGCARTGAILLREEAGWKWMSIEDTIGFRQNIPACAVCGKNVQGSGGFARVNHAGHLIELCCPLCVETFEKDPAPYLRRLEKIEYFRYLAQLETPAAKP